MSGRDRSPRKDNDGRMKKGNVDRRIFVNNLPYEMTWQAVKDLFRKEVGEVNFVELFNDEQGRPRGAGIMEFASTDLAKRAIEKMNRFDFKGRKIVVKEDFDVERDKHGRIITEKDKERGFGGRGAAGSSGGRGSGQVERAATQGPVDYGNTYGLSVRFLESLGIDGPLNTRIFVSNLSYDIDERKLREVFRLAGNVVAIELARDKEGKSRGFAVVVYDHPVEAVQAISMLGDQQLMDRRLAVRMDKSKGEEPPRNMNRIPEGLSGVGMGLGDNGTPLWDVRNNLPSDTGNTMNSGMNSGMAGGMGMQDMQAQSSVVNNTAATALQTALAAIMTAGAGLGGVGQQQTGNSALTALLGAGGLSGGLGGANNSLNGGGGMSMSSGLGRSDDMGAMGSSSMTDRIGMNSMIDRLDNYNDRLGSMGGMDRMSTMDMDRGMDRSRLGGMSSGGMMGGSSNGMMGGSSSGMMGGSSSGMMGGSSSGMMGGSSSGMMGGSSSGMNGGSGAYKSDRDKFSDKVQTLRNNGYNNNNKVIVRNLPTNMSWQALKDKFLSVGDVKYAEMKERGCGIIRFATEREAERAVGAMNRQRLDGRTIEVSLY